MALPFNPQLSRSFLPLRCPFRVIRPNGEGNGEGAFVNVYIRDARLGRVSRSVAGYTRAVERFSKAIPTVKSSEIEFDRAFNDLMTTLRAPSVRHLLEEIIDCHKEALDEIELGLLREERRQAIGIELDIARQYGIKTRHARAILESPSPSPEQLQLFDDTDALLAAMEALHERRRTLITQSRQMEKRQKKIFKKNVKQATVSSSFAVVMFASNGIVAPALLPISGGAGLFAMHSAFRDLSE